MNWSEFSPYFQSSEFDCNCGCKFNNMCVFFIRRLTNIRKEANFPFHIISGRRCPTHNKNSRGADMSAHLSGQAADIRIDNSVHRSKIIRVSLAFGINRIGIARTFVHLDTASHLTSNVTWLY